MTRRLYHDDSALEFDATLLEVVEHGGRPALVLDRTAFYPEGGGQPCDLGRLAGREVLAVFAEHENGPVLHLVAAGPPLEIGRRVHGAVDAARRLDHTQQHTGQHLLSAALVEVLGLETRSFHMGARSSTIDIDPPRALRDLARAEERANAIIFEDRPLHVHQVDAADLARYRVRRQTFHGARVRLVEIEGFDVSTCGGTHAARTGAVGLVAIVGVENVKGLRRVEFVCGGRALRTFHAQRRVLSTLTDLLSTGEEQLGERVERLLQGERAARKRNAELFARVARDQARRWIVEAPTKGSLHLVLRELADLEVAEARVLARELSRGEAVLAVLIVARGGERRILLSCSADTGRNAGEVLRGLLGRFGGRGGGSQTEAEGLLDPKADVAALFAAVTDATRTVTRRELGGK